MNKSYRRLFYILKASTVMCDMLSFRMCVAVCVAEKEKILDDLESPQTNREYIFWDPVLFYPIRSIQTKEEQKQMV